MPWKNYNSNTVLLVSSFVVFLLLSIYFVPNNQSPSIGALLTCATFIYGSFTAFTVSISINRFTKIRETLKQNDAYLLNIWILSAVFDDKTREKLKKLLDEHIMSQIDYSLYDFKYTYESFLALHQFLLEIKVATKQQEVIYREILRSLSLLLNHRKTIEALVREAIVFSEWAVILTLQFIIVFCILARNEGTITSVITTTLLTTSLVAISVILRNFNNLSWKEEYWAWQPLEELLMQFNLIPYFPQEVLTSGRAKPKIGRKIRVGYFPHKYPDLRGKKIKIEVVEKGRK